MNMLNRVKRIEKRLTTYNALPVLFVESKEEIEQYRSQIDEKTVIFIDDYGEDYD
ncbi:hypothetical protein [Halobacillus halophilus]|uniref:hypothetical protein n=1 Tax=Halobacillus halophilus TaxID=1570 RepID=UPI001CD3B237|nr:hypothetical protein [Halobacillus halophilus]MCA1011391.1 hypothetical protein [Halobacillus halophilus]